MSAPLSGDDMALDLPDEEQVSTPSPATSNVDYTQGFGPFWFHPKDPEPIRQPRRRKTIFTFLKLPAEIRRMIYKYLVDELVTTRPDDASGASRPDSGLRFMVKEAEEPSGDYHLQSGHKRQRPVPPLFILEAPDQRTRQSIFNNGVDTEVLDVLRVYTSIADLWCTQTAGTPTPAQCPELYSEIRAKDRYAESDEAEFSDADSDASSWCSDDAEVVMHSRWRSDAQINAIRSITSEWGTDLPGSESGAGSSKANAGNLSVTTTLRVTTAIAGGPMPTKRSHQSKRRRVRAAIRNLSLTSAQIAYELGEVLWAKSTVHVASPECFLAFARDRPAALPLIHGVVLNLDTGYEGLLFEETMLSLVAMMRILTEHCRLRVLRPVFPPSLPSMNHYDEGQTDAEFTAAMMRDMRVLKVFREHPDAYDKII